MIALYLLSLKTCPYSYEEEEDCIDYFRTAYPILLGVDILSGIILTIVLIISLKGAVSRYWWLPGLIVFLFCFFWQSGMDMDDHGGVNRFTLVATILVISGDYLFYVSQKSLYKYSTFLFIVFWTSLGIAFVAFYQLKITNSWIGWTDGLKKTSII